MGDRPADRLDTLLLLALPASGKSEIRRYLGSLDAAEAARLHLGPLVDLDDYPYVHLMRRISEELRRAGAAPVFFDGPAGSFLDARDWLSLIELLNEDHAVAVGTGSPGDATPAGFLDRLDRARSRVGIDQPAGGLAGAGGGGLAGAVAGDVAALPTPTSRHPGGTIVAEFARGGPAGAEPPLPWPVGYQHSLARLDPSLLAAACILYVAVDPAESRRRNRERTIPGGDASVLHHGVPEEVMRHDYGSDDFGWLLEHARVEGTVTVDHPEAGALHVPAAVFDNRVDRTSFLRSDPQDWPPDRVEALHRSLAGALGDLAARR
jgi:hypothetical protein